MNKTAPTAASGFAYSAADFDQLIEQAFVQARQLGVADCSVLASEGLGLSVETRLGELEGVNHHRSKSLTITVYEGARNGSANTSDFSAAAIAQTVRAAYDIARYTAEDPFAALPDVEDLCSAAEAQRDLDLFHPWDLSSAAATELALRCERAAMILDPRLKNSDGASVSTGQSHFRTADMRGGEAGLLLGYPTSRHSLSVSPIAVGDDGQMQRDYWFSSECSPEDLATPEAVGRHAAQRSLSRLGARKIPTQSCPVLFDAPMAAGLLGAFAQGISGSALYRKTSYLNDSLGQQIFPSALRIQDNPFILRGKGSCPFDNAGCRVSNRELVGAGIVQGYLLAPYAARKMHMRPTGNTGGSHNLQWFWAHTEASDDLDAMLKRLGTGLFVTELMGQGVNYLTGDYSRGASGFWVENGEIAFPVEEITIAGKLKDMFRGISHIGNDVFVYGGKRTGSVLIDHMKIAGH